VKDKIVIVLRYVPETSSLRRAQPHVIISPYKAMLAREHGAKPCYRYHPNSRTQGIDSVAVILPAPSGIVAADYRKLADSLPRLRKK
jgi:hypothetical protein